MTHYTNLDRAESEAVKRNKYTPDVEKAAVVLSALTLSNVTEAGPITIDHAVMSILPVGRPSSVAVPFRLADASKVIV